MSMRIGKALIVDCDKKTRSVANNLLLSSARQPFDYASNLVEAVELLKRNNYVCIFAGSEIPAVAGVSPRRQDLENLLDEIDMLKGMLKPPVVCLYTKAPDMDDDTWTCWTTDMTLRGVVKWVRKPFPSSGRTPDRMLKKILSGQYMRLVKASPLTPSELMAAPLRADHSSAGVEARVHSDEAADKVPGHMAPKDNIINPAAKMDGTAVISKLKKIVEGKGCAKAGLLASVCHEAAPSAQETHQPAKEEIGQVAAQATPPPPDNRWAGVSNEPIDIDDFMARFCESRSKEHRTCRKRALLAAARHKTVKLPPLAGPHKHGQPNRYLVHGLLAAWQNFLDEGVDVPRLLTLSDSAGRDKELTLQRHAE